MSAIEVEENGRSVHQLLPEPPSMADEITAEIADIEASVLKDTQQGEVAAKFLREARSYAFAGKVQLAIRKRKAARCVLTGKYEDE